MRGEPVTVSWQGRPVEAFLPAVLDPDTVGLGEATVRATEQAAAAVERCGRLEVGGVEAAARLLLRSEGVASSAIEGLHPQAASVAMAELDETIGGTVGWVADNLAVISAALDHPEPLTVETLFEWHDRLMRHSTLAADLIGAWRDRQGWVGGPNPMTAAYVPPPPEAIDALMRDLVAGANRTDIDAVTLAALVHAQFETIHPFGDGNGRVGRVLISWLLHRRLDVAVPPPLSLSFSRDIGGYLSGLTRYRADEREPWVAWFAGALTRAASDAGDVLAEVDRLLASWRERVADLRVDSAGRRLVEVLAAHPALDAAVAASVLGVTPQSARVGLAALAERGVIQPWAPDRPIEHTGPARRGQWWVATELLDLVGP